LAAVAIDASYAFHCLAFEPLRIETAEGAASSRFELHSSVTDESINRAHSPDAENQSDERDRADMERLAAGHEAALNELMERHAPKLFNYLIRCLQNGEDAADAAQETFVRVYQHRAKFDLSQKFSTWLYAIATNLIKDRYRYRTRHPQVSLDAENETTGKDFREALPGGAPSPVEAMEASERAETIRRAVAALPDELRIPLILAEYEERSHAEIGEILRCTAKAVETRIYRARQQLRLSLAELLGAT
jgi:RNA polymerase sigma-70 factor (ECF subfamily)